MKVCKDCRWEKNRNCHSPKNGVDPVDGKANWNLCRLNRLSPLWEDSNKCGPDAEWFEKRSGIRLTYDQGVVIMVVMIFLLVVIGVLS